MNMEEVNINEESDENIPNKTNISVEKNSTTDETEEKETLFTENTLNKLRDGVLEIYQPPFEQFKSQLEELTTKQNILVEQLHNENLNLVHNQNSEEFQELFKKIQIYKNKLVNMKMDMKNLHDKSQKLVKRASRLQQLKEKDDLMKQEQREKEAQLIGNPSTSTEKTTES